MLQYFKLKYVIPLIALGLVTSGFSIAVVTAPHRFSTGLQNAPQPVVAKAELKAATLEIPRTSTETITPKDESKSIETISDKKHPAEAQRDLDLFATSIRFVNGTSAQIAIFELTAEGQRRPQGIIAPRDSAEFPTITGTRWVVADAKHNAIAVFIADGQPRTIEINDDQVENWTHHLALDQIVVRGEQGETLQTFCMGPDENLYALLAVPEVYGEIPTAQAFSTHDHGEVRVYSPSGEEIYRFALDFKPHRIAVAPDGEIVIGGFGVIAHFTSEGRLLNKHMPPNLSGAESELKKAAMAAREAAMLQCKEQIALLEEQGRAQRSQSALFAQMIQPHQAQLEAIQGQSIEDSVKDLKRTLGQVHAITASLENIYVAMPMSTGHGFAVWKMERDAAEGRLIIENLAGCCGHLDLQVKGQDLFVAENSRHRVLRFDQEGKKLAQFGKRERGGDGEGFGGCCNPMNLFFTTKGEILTAESDGRVKCYSQEGKFVRDLASAPIFGGCKNVAIAATKNRDRVFVLDVTESKIFISSAGEDRTSKGS